MNPIVSPDGWMAHSHWSRRTLAAGELGEMLTVSDRLLRILPCFLQAPGRSAFLARREPGCDGIAGEWPVQPVDCDVDRVPFE